MGKPFFFKIKLILKSHVSFEGVYQQEKKIIWIGWDWDPIYNNSSLYIPNEIPSTTIHHCKSQQSLWHVFFCLGRAVCYTWLVIFWRTWQWYPTDEPIIVSYFGLLICFFLLQFNLLFTLFLPWTCQLSSRSRPNFDFNWRIVLIFGSLSVRTFSSWSLEHKFDAISIIFWAPYK